MRTIRCRRCQKMFEYEGKEYCSFCTMQEEHRFQSVRQLVRENPGITVAEVHFQTDVPVSVIWDYVKQGSLEVIKNNENFEKMDIWQRRMPKKELVSSIEEISENQEEEKRNASRLRFRDDK